MTTVDAAAGERGVDIQDGSTDEVVPYHTSSLNRNVMFVSF
jgi:hypothetical protein